VEGDLASGIAHLRRAIEHAAHLLPAQGPIRVFIHHNTLHAFEDLPFHEAVCRGAEVFGCHPYLPEEQYRQHLTRGRIRTADLEAVLRETLGDRADEPLFRLGTRRSLRLAMLQYPVRTAPAAELRWFVAETDALTRFRAEAAPALRESMRNETRHWIMRDWRDGREHAARGDRTGREPGFRAWVRELLEKSGEASIEQWSDELWDGLTLQALWQVCHDGLADVPHPAPPPCPPVRHRDLLLQVTNEDSDLLVHGVLIRFCAAFLDQGFSHWPLPARDRGFFRAFCDLYRQAAGPPDRWLRGLKHELSRLAEAHTGPAESILESLRILGVDESQWDSFLTATLLAQRGWAGMIWQLETRGDRVAHPAPGGSLLEYVAVRLILERVALTHLARATLGYRGPLDRLPHVLRGSWQSPDEDRVERRAFVLFQLAQVLGWLPADLHRLSGREWSLLVEEVEAFSELERRRVFQLAYERRYRTQVLDALSVGARRPPAETRQARFQVLTCLDEREESFRRHVEELGPDVETYGAAGFFNIAMYYRGAADAHFVPLCPVVIRPQHWVTEDVVFTLDDAHRRRAKARRGLGTASHQLHVGSRTFASGAVLAAGIGALASVPLVMRVLLPRWTARLRHAAGRLLRPPPMTQLQLERAQPTPGPAEGQQGFSVEEMAMIVERLLRDVGLISNFACLVMVVGHGSTSLNNPHESAHDCGACGGGGGGPNARALAQMANDPRVRARLQEQGLVLPPETLFVGVLHNTCDDSLTFYDLDRLPRTHQNEFEQVRDWMEEACDRNAHERSRRFELAPLDISFPAARRHVEGRSQDLAETRPEYGHASNAVCVVGRRGRTRGLFMDRRTFLVSYDPTLDDGEDAILTRILQAAVPVCAGINLEYYFSYVDPVGWGCGTKLPHNLASLLGVMDGAGSDLRTGLPWQMVEIHEPVRLLFVIEATPETLLRLLDRNPPIGKLVRNGWVQLTALSPSSSEIHVFRDGRFEPYRPETSELPTVASSVDWYRGWRDHLGFAMVKTGPGEASGESQR
jgi:uncharacterized protein YbcC (UPF0753/DUF2309 family)